MYFTCDDVSVKYKHDLYKLEKLRERYPQFKVTCFVIAKDLDAELANWLKQDWVQVGCHGYEHDYPPECERDDKETRIRKATAILRPLFPDIKGFRAPGFQMTATTYPILRELGYNYIAHETKIQPFKGQVKMVQIVNSHIYDELDYTFNVNEIFNFISEGYENIDNNTG